MADRWDAAFLVDEWRYSEAAFGRISEAVGAEHAERVNHWARVYRSMRANEKQKPKSGAIRKQLVELANACQRLRDALDMHDNTIEALDDAMPGYSTGGIRRRLADDAEGLRESCSYRALTIVVQGDDLVPREIQHRARHGVAAELGHALAQSVEPDPPAILQRAGDRDTVRIGAEPRAVGRDFAALEVRRVEGGEADEGARLQRHAARIEKELHVEFRRERQIPDAVGRELRDRPLVEQHAA